MTRASPIVIHISLSKFLKRIIQNEKLNYCIGKDLVRSHCNPYILNTFILKNSSHNW